MTVTLVSRETKDEIVGACIYYGLATADTADTVGQALTDANLAAVGYQLGYTVTTDIYRYQPRSVTIGQRARSLAVYIGCCQTHPAWPMSEARGICVVLACAFLQDIPGYGDAVAR